MPSNSMGQAQWKFKVITRMSANIEFTNSIYACIEIVAHVIRQQLILPFHTMRGREGKQ